MASILVVDDHLLNRHFLMSLLGYGGHRLLEAEDGAVALDIVRSERPDLVISDILMPEMDGYEFVTRLRADPSIASTPVIFFTATYREREVKVLADACGKWCSVHSDFLPKTRYRCRPARPKRQILKRPAN
jgi:CheY-like chemotaxis protein